MLNSLTITCLVGLISFSFLDGCKSPPPDSMLDGLSEWQVTPLLTVGEQLPSTDFRFAASHYQPVGLMDGLGSFLLDGQTVRIFVNHELPREAGYSYHLKNETSLTGARVSFFDIDRKTRRIVNSGIGYDTIRDRQGRDVTSAEQINEENNDLHGFSRFCSAHLVLKGTYGFRDTIFFTHEEVNDPPEHPYGGSLWALDVENQVLHAVPSAGRMAWENTAPLHIDGDHVALLIGNDTIPQTDEPNKYGQEAISSTSARQVVTAPLWLYIGKKNVSPFEVRNALPAEFELPQDEFLNRNGLLVGGLYYFVSNAGITSTAQFKGTGSSLKGTWRKIEVFDSTKAGKPGFDRFGYKNGFTLRREAKAGGAFQFSRPEDISTHPTIGTKVAFSSTGHDTLFAGHEEWGAIYQVDVDIPNLSSTIHILYDGDDAGGQFQHPDFGIRSPDNLDWSEDGFIYIQEDNAKRDPPLFGSRSREESSIWQLDPETGTVQRIARINRSIVLPEGTTDRSPEIIGQWESSGILDVTMLFETHAKERLLLAVVQAHTIQDGIIHEANLVESGQLVLLNKRL